MELKKKFGKHLTIELEAHKPKSIKELVEFGLLVFAIVLVIILIVWWIV
ncbi:hypothetical protein [Fructilactobacillus fructivorans]|nr:hypothetical protein [Fructilactobacillus fructivorans]